MIDENVDEAEGSKLGFAPGELVLRNRLHLREIPRVGVASARRGWLGNNAWNTRRAAY